jgi:hypothetical protein
MEDGKRGGIGKRMSVTQRACMSEMAIGANPPIVNALKVEMVKLVGKFITHDSHV